MSSAGSRAQGPHDHAADGRRVRARRPPRPGSGAAPAGPRGRGRLGRATRRSRKQAQVRGAARGPGGGSSRRPARDRRAAGGGTGGAGLGITKRATCHLSALGCNPLLEIGRDIRRVQELLGHVGGGDDELPHGGTSPRFWRVLRPADRVPSGIAGRSWEGPLMSKLRPWDRCRDSRFRQTCRSRSASPWPTGSAGTRKGSGSS